MKTYTDDELKTLRELWTGYSGMRGRHHNERTEVLAIIDEALSRGAKRDSDSDAFILALTELTRERDEARAALAERDAEGLVHTPEELISAVNSAAAVRCRANAADVPKHAQEATERIVQWHERAAGHESDAAQIRALSSSPPSGQWVAADVMERVKAALMRKRPTWGSGKDMRESEAEEASFESDRRAALSALESEASR